MNKEEREQLERNIIGAILNMPKGLHEVRRALKPEIFRTQFHRKVMQSIFACLSADVEVNVVNIATLGKFNPQENVDLCGIPAGGGDLQLLAKTLTEAVIVE
ncbi:MAG: DnaB-like helicase N-terminal domain-containing protein, partial [Polyangia bacterium]